MQIKIMITHQATCTSKKWVQISVQKSRIIHIRKRKTATDNSIVQVFNFNGCKLHFNYAIYKNHGTHQAVCISKGWKRFLIGNPELSQKHLWPIIAFFKYSYFGNSCSSPYIAINRKRDQISIWKSDMEIQKHLFKPNSGKLHF